MFIKLVAQLSLFVISFFIGLGVMIFGWGLEPSSWGWIIGGALMVLLCTVVIVVIQQMKE